MLFIWDLGGYWRGWGLRCDVKGVAGELSACDDGGAIMQRGSHTHTDKASHSIIFRLRLCHDNPDNLHPLARFCSKQDCHATSQSIVIRRLAAKALRNLPVEASNGFQASFEI